MLDMRTCGIELLVIRCKRKIFSSLVPYTKYTSSLLCMRTLIDIFRFRHAHGARELRLGNRASSRLARENKE